MVGTCPSSVAYGQDIADLGVVTRTQQAMVNSIEYATLEDQARSKYAHDINAALVASVADDARDNAGDEPYQLDGYESSSTSSSDSLNLTWYTAKAEDAEDSDYEDAPAPEQPFQAEWEAAVKGRATEAKPPRFNIQELKPWEVMFADEKEFPTPQRGGTKTSFILLEYKSDAWFFKAETTKTQHGDSFRKIMVENGVHLLEYPRTVYTDGCGSMAIKMGINYIAIPPHSQSLNEAERIADRLWACARI